MTCEYYVHMRTLAVASLLQLCNPLVCASSAEHVLALEEISSPYLWPF